MTIIEKNIHRTNLQRIKDALCLLFPIAAAFGGYFAADYFTDKEIFKFLAAGGAFLIITGIEFILTRKINPIMKIGIFSGEDVPSQEN